MFIEIPCRTANIRDLKERRTLPSSGVTYGLDAQERL